MSGPRAFLLSLLLCMAPGSANAQLTLAETLKPVLIPERIALRVFDPAQGGPNAGPQFIRMPGGAIYQRSGIGEGRVGGEVFRLAIRIKTASRQKWMAGLHAQNDERLPRPREGRPLRPIDAAPKPLSAFFSDESLTAGDVVVAVEGFRVFRGSGNFPWRAADFVPVERWRQDNARRRNLNALERESRRAR